MSQSTNTMQSELFIVLSFIFILLAVQLLKNEHAENAKKKELSKIIEEMQFKADSIDSVLNKKEVVLPYPPVIQLSEKDAKYRFNSSSFYLQSPYRRALEALVPQIDSLADLYQCNAIQIVGHTDGVPYFMNAKNELDRDNNIDDNYGKILKGFEEGIFDNDFNIQPATNFDLGVLRAMAVSSYLNAYGKEWSLLENIEYWHPYSAGPLILENGKLVKSNRVEADSEKGDAARRRIEIRLFRYNPEPI